MQFVKLFYTLFVLYILLSVLRKIFCKKKKPKPSDYIGRSEEDFLSWEMLCNKNSAKFFKTRKKQEELEIIRELDYDEHEIRRIP